MHRNEIFLSPSCNVHCNADKSGCLKQVAKQSMKSISNLALLVSQERVGRIMVGQKVHEWLDFYDLKTRLTFGPELNRDEMLTNDRVCNSESISDGRGADHVLIS